MPTEEPTNDLAQASNPDAGAQAGADSSATAASATTDGDRGRVQQSLKDAWLGVLSGAESEAARAAQRLFEVVGLHPPTGDGPALVKEAMREISERVRLNRDALERRVEEGVRQAAARVRRPLQAELATIRARVEDLQARLDARRDKKATSPDEGAH
jgi:hypothetical protein